MRKSREPIDRLLSFLTRADMDIEHNSGGIPL